MWPPQDDKAGKIFKETSLSFFEECKVLHMQVMRAIAVGLGIEEGWFDEYTDRGDNTLRLLHYPPVRKDVFVKNKLQVRAGEHTDYGKFVRVLVMLVLIWARFHYATLPRLSRWSPSPVSKRHIRGRNPHPRYHCHKRW